MFFVFWLAILGENLAYYMGKQSSNSQLRPATPDEATTTHHAAPLEGRLLDRKFLLICALIDTSSLYCCCIDAKQYALNLLLYSHQMH